MSDPDVPPLPPRFPKGDPRNLERWRAVLNTARENFRRGIEPHLSGHVPMRGKHEPSRAEVNAAIAAMERELGEDES